MTMHLEHPALTTTGKRRGKKKWTSSEAKRKSQQLAEEWQDNLARWAKMAPKFSSGKIDTKKRTTESYAVTPRIPPSRESQNIPSLPFTGDACVKSPGNVYTGTAVAGIVVQHKSCLQPVFSIEEAKDSAKMRR
jgi:hypothetical protein